MPPGSPSGRSGCRTGDGATRTLAMSRAHPTARTVGDSSRSEPPRTAVVLRLVTMLAGADLTTRDARPGSPDQVPATGPVSFDRRPPARSPRGQVAVRLPMIAR